MTFHPTDKFPSRLPPCNYDEYIYQDFRMIRLNSTTLTHLNLKHIILTTLQVIRDLARTISQLHRLIFLRLSAITNHSFTRRTFETIFYSCPSSLTSLIIARKISRTTGRKMILDSVKNDWNFEQGPLVLRKSPLLCLRHLSLPTML
ncbi:hypothetical protein BG015_002062, partial [Linnemannia schmuckeri]